MNHAPSLDVRLTLQPATAGLPVLLASVVLGEGTPATRLLPLHFLEALRSAALADLARGEARRSAATEAAARALFSEVFPDPGVLGSGARLRIRSVDPKWDEVPWELLLRPGDQECLGTQSGLSVLREAPGRGGVYSPAVSESVGGFDAGPDAPVVPGSMGPAAGGRASARLLVISPLGDEVERHLAGLGESVGLSLLPAITRPLRHRALLEHLRALPAAPHGVHFLGHGRVSGGGRPELCLGQLDDSDDPEDALWVSAESLANTLADVFGGRVRWVYLESCDTAVSGAFGSAAQRFVQSGVPAAIGQLWPVPQRAARALRHGFYKAFLSSGAAFGDVGASLQIARRVAVDELGGSDAQAMSAVVCLGARSPRLFGALTGSAPTATNTLPAEVAHALSRPAAVILADAPALHGPTGLLDKLRERFEARLAQLGEPQEDLPLHALAQRVRMAGGPAEVRQIFNRLLYASPIASTAPGSATATVSWLDALAPAVRPGVHVSLLWLPALELALARAFPQAHVWAVQPMLGDRGVLNIEHRPAGAGSFVESVPDLSAMNLERDYLVLQLFGGQTPSSNATEAQALSEDEQLEALSRIEQCLPGALQNAVFGSLRSRPWVIAGLECLDWPQRELLRRLSDGQPLRAGSISWLFDSPSVSERNFWTRPPPLGCGASLVVGR